ncbi:hypothetical protein AGMMS49982_20780 [Bacteroidia bacterium]|nr:hypothetical protein AGMMS49982_20780 [Bacteroidia bacterium]
MTKEAYLALAAEHYEELEKLKEKDSLYDFEKGLDAVCTKFGRHYLETALNETSNTKDRRKKKLSPDLGRFQL